MPLNSGEIFAGFRIVGLLGSGGMGEVYLAQHPRLPRHDALKILGTDVSVDEEYRQRFIREADLAATLWHPNIVRVNDRGEFNGQLWISMDYVEGTDAASLMQDRYPAGMPADEVAAIVAAIASALDYAHQRGLLHRDVKPGNILLASPENGEQRTLLSDFGIARNIGDVSGLTATNMTMGTLPYAAPEQLMDEQMDGRADQYALAATAYHLLTGSPLFPQSNPAVVISRHLNTPPPTLADTHPALAALDPVLAPALAKDPADRFARCTDFARSFADAVQPADRGAAWAPTMRSPVASRPPARTAVPPLQADTGQKRRRHRILLGAALAVVVLVAVGVIGHMNQPKHNTASTPSPPTAVLDGTYRMVYDVTKETVNGAPFPEAQPNTDNTRWWAFRSLCSSTGCVATGTALDKNNQQVISTPAFTSVLHFADGRWQQTTTDRFQVDNPQCLGVDGKVVAGADTETSAWSWEPQPDGTLRGVRTDTVLTNECGHQGLVLQFPAVANRTGDVPAGVTVADPAAVPASLATSTPAPPATGPILDGAYRFDFDAAHPTLNGEQVTVDVKKDSEWWAFRSSCTSTRCVAVGALLVDNNQQAPSGTAAAVFQFTDGRWQDTPRLQAPAPCYTGNGAKMLTKSWSLQPQPDGTLRGAETATVLTNECGGQGTVVKFPIVVTRIGDVPPAVILADPALFAS